MPDETLAESAWERQMNIAGVEAFERGRLDAKGNARGASETRTGVKTIRDLVDRATVGIEEMQREVIRAHRMDLDVKATAIMLPPDSAALLTLRVMIDRAYGSADPELGFTFQTIANEVSRAIELELNFRNWIRESKHASDAWAKSKGLTRAPKSIAERLLEDEGVNARSIRRWRRAFDDLNLYKWGTLESHYCGDAMISAVAKALPEVFEIHTPWKRGKSIKMVKMVPEFRQHFDRMEGDFANMQVLKKPMLARPRPWTREEETTE